MTFMRVNDSPGLRAAALAFSRADAETRRAVQAETRGFAPAIVHAAVARAPGKIERAVAVSGRTKVHAKGFRAEFGAVGALRQGVPLREIARPYEFGTTRQNVKKRHRGRSPKGRYYQVHRRTQRQLPPESEGRFVYQALADVAPDLVARYVRAIARAVQGG